MKKSFIIILFLLLFFSPGILAEPLNTDENPLVIRMDVGEKIACTYDFNIKAMSNGVMTDLGISAEKKNDIDFHVSVVLTFEKISDSYGGTFKVVDFYNGSSTSSSFDSQNIDAYFNGNKIYPAIKNNIYDLEFDHSDDNVCYNLVLTDAEKCTNGQIYTISTAECPMIYYNPASGLISTSLHSTYSGVSYSTNSNDRICVSFADSSDEDDDVLLTEHTCAYSVIARGYRYIEDSNNQVNTGGDINDPKLDDVCQSMPTEIMDYIKEALKLIRWLGLVLMIVLGTLDFVKAAAADDQDAMKKASQNFIKRLIAVIILFLLPIMIELILSILSMIGFDFAKCFHIVDF